MQCSFSHSQLGWVTQSKHLVHLWTLKYQKISLERKKGGRYHSKAGSRACSGRTGPLWIAIERGVKAWNKKDWTVKCPAPWPNLVYLDESRVHIVSLLCQKGKWKTRENERSRSLSFGHQVRLLFLRSTPPFALTHIANGFLPWNKAERTKSDPIQFNSTWNKLLIGV